MLGKGDDQKMFSRNSKSNKIVNEIQFLNFHPYDVDNPKCRSTWNIIFSILRCFSSKNEQKCRFLKIKKFILILDIFMTYDRIVPNDTGF